MKKPIGIAWAILGLILLGLAVAGGWWLASDHPGSSLAAPAPSPAPKPSPIVTAAPIPVQPAPSPFAAPGKDLPAETPNALVKKYEERDLPPAEDIAKFLNGEAPSSIKESPNKK